MRKLTVFLLLILLFISVGCVGDSKTAATTAAPPTSVPATTKVAPPISIRPPRSAVKLQEDIDITAGALSDDLNFVPDQGIRMTGAAIPATGIDEDGRVYLYYNDFYKRAILLSISSDGLTFDRGSAPHDWTYHPRVIKMPEPDENGNTIYRQYRWDLKGNMLSESSTDGSNFTKDEGIRYTLQDIDKGTAGTYLHVVHKDGGVLMLYVGDSAGLNNIRSAYSPPGNNGLNFEFLKDNVLDDAKNGGGGRSYVDQRPITLPDGRLRMFAMQMGRIFSFTSDDGGRTFSKDPGVRLSPTDFEEMNLGGILNDPGIVMLPDGRYRLYVAGKIGGGDEVPSQGPPEPGTEENRVIVSATSVGPS